MGTKLNGQYTPYEAGARRLSEASELTIDNQLVTAHVYDERQISVFIGMTMIYDGPLPQSITYPQQINPFVRDMAINHGTRRDTMRYA